MTELRALYFDDETGERDQYEPIWQKILGSFGRDVDIRYDPDIKTFADRLKDRPHVVVADNLLARKDWKDARREQDNAGIKFISTHKPSHPDTVFILYTGGDFSIAQLGQRIPNPDIIVTKDYLHMKDYQDFIRKEIERRVCRLPLQQINIPANQDEDAPSKQIVQSLIEQVVFDFSADKSEESFFSAASVTEISGGFSGASVYKLELAGADSGVSIPTVLKIGPKEQINRERTAFQKYAKWYLPHDMRVDIVGAGHTGKFSAICYAFALGGETKVLTLADALMQGQTRQIESVVRKLFNSKLQGWYQPSGRKSESLQSFFSNLKEYPKEKDEWRQTCLRRTIRRVADREDLDCDIRNGDFRIGTLSFPDVRRTLRNVGNHQVPFCVSHGDLNANNIFLNGSASSIALIDFEQTGHTHVFRDFVSLESSVRSLLPLQKKTRLSFLDRIEAETYLLNNTPPSRRLDIVTRQVKKIRDAAFQKFPDADPKIYHTALILHIWKLIGFQSSDGKSLWTDQGEESLLAGLIASITHLEAT